MKTIFTFVPSKTHEFPDHPERPGRLDVLEPLLASVDAERIEAARATTEQIALGTNATTGRPDATITPGKLATDRLLHTATKIDARVIWSGEMDEDSLIPFISQLRGQLDTSAMETMEQIVLDGDTATGATTNINHIGGTPTTGDIYLAFDGIRKLALVTNTANSRSAGGALTDTDFLATAKLMGTAGLYGADNRPLFVIDANTRWKALQLASLKTQDVFSNATLEGGELAGVWGYRVYASYHMHKGPRAARCRSPVRFRASGSALPVRP